MCIRDRRRAVQIELDQMIDADIIERSVSPYSNPLVVFIKKDGKVRLCLDARRINQIIIPYIIHPNPWTKFFRNSAGLNI